jgi:hypothetical protein
MLFTLYRTLDSGPPAKYVWGLLFASSIAILLRVILKRNYMELRESKLFVYGDLFHTQTTDISAIERIEIEPGPFSHSKIFLKEKKGIIRFNYSNVDDTEFKVLVKYLNVPLK